MTSDQKLVKIWTELNEMKFADELAEPEEFWMDIESRCDNATDVIYDMDAWVKKTIDLIESK